MLDKKDVKGNGNYQESSNETKALQTLERGIGFLDVRINELRLQNEQLRSEVESLQGALNSGDDPSLHQIILLKNQEISSNQKFIEYCQEILEILAPSNAV
jgi:hypothetical protein